MGRPGNNYSRQPCHMCKLDPQPPHVNKKTYILSPDGMLKILRGFHSRNGGEAGLSYVLNMHTVTVDGF